MNLTDVVSLTWRISPELLGVLNADGYFELTNPAWQKKLGWSETEIRSKQFLDFLHPDDLARSQEAFSQIKQGVPALHFENRYQTKAGDYLWLSWIAVPEGGKFYCSARDISAEKERAQALIERTAELDRVWRLSQDLLVVASDAGKIEATNAAWMRILGWEPGELSGVSFTEFTHPDDLDRAFDVLRALLEKPLIKPHEMRLRHKDGSYRWVAWTAAFEDGKIFANGRDTSTEHRQQDAIRSQEEAARLREQFIAVLGHDLRNPLSAIGGGARSLLREDQSEKSRKIIGLMQGSAVRMSVLIDNVLDFARGSLGDGIALSRSADTPLEPMLTHLVDELRVGTDHQVESDFDITTQVNCDPSRLGQLVSNLLGNALTHGDPDTPVKIHAATRNGEFELWVSNGGSPISEKAKEKLFQPFFRGEVRESQQGLGLGLFIAYEIAKAHGGALSVLSSEKETRFIFRMPIQPE